MITAVSASSTNSNKKQAMSNAKKSAVGSAILGAGLQSVFSVGDYFKNSKYIKANNLKKDFFKGAFKTVSKCALVSAILGSCVSLAGSLLTARK